MGKKINLEEIIKDELYNRHLFFNKINNVQIKNICLEFGKQLLELAAENAKLREQADIYDNGESELDSECSVAFGSVTDCYNNTLPSKITVSISSILDTIKQIE